ncbi:MAG: HAD family hydrolase [Chromatiales bacterium]|jgi:FMN phosphatase YigB (HAD superfamily)|nr:HAD family hydrolase [Chromatiales bacterium]
MNKCPWVFFDCFNTLLDEADGLTGETGMLPIAHLPVEAGRFTTCEDFISAYVKWRAQAWPSAGDDTDDGGQYREIPLSHRLTAVLGPDAEQLVDAMVDAFAAGYPTTLSMTPGVETMLEHVSTRFRCGVVSNIFLPGLPAQLLSDFGLGKYFEFIVDSAELGFKKPDRRIYAAALELASALPADVVFVGDNRQNDALAPAALGMQGVWFNRKKVPGAHAANGNVTEFSTIKNWSQFPSLLSRLLASSDGH